MIDAIRKWLGQKPEAPTVPEPTGPVPNLHRVSMDELNIALYRVWISARSAKPFDEARLKALADVARHRKERNRLARKSATTTNQVSDTPGIGVESNPRKSDTRDV